MALITTPLTQQLGIEHPVLLAGMGMTSTAALAAAVSNAGGLGVIGGVGYTAAQLREMMAELKGLLRDPGLPFGVDLLLPQVGGSARRTNHDYTKGALDELVDAIIGGGARLFVSAVGVPPRRVVERLHAAGVLYMNMVGHPRHVAKACAAGADIICAQGGEAGGHTGDIPFSVLVPACADLCRRHGHVSPLMGRPVAVVAAGGVGDGRGLAAALMLGAQAVWVGTRFVAARESGASAAARRAVLRAGFDDVVRSLVWTGRPLRALRTPYVDDWERNRQGEIRDLTARGIVPLEHELDRLHAEGKLTDEIMDQAELRPMGIVAGLVNTPDQTAKEIVDEIVTQAAALLGSAGNYVSSKPKL
ncbi:putative 2-nitropropane NPD [Rosellinia necatrix]|uniref:Putative 2-nitropropane NPD n=1 Tax=Rosellinia necatrix TaxID=77044 RepID=A0A1S8A5A4_ROSNE|nr:putative 2-nitropropane NPD [Rosellinia necatrix]